MSFNPIQWIEENIELRETNSAEFIYDLMESQSNKFLPIIYQPFNAQNRMHFVDRAQILDFSVAAGSGKLLDFGPGDGWPSLMVAQYADEVVGVDGSKRRVDVCKRNAERLGVTNAVFHHVSPGEPLPFDDDSFDGVMAASSVELTPSPFATLQELNRVLRPDGCLRIYYEALAIYRDGQEKSIWIAASDENQTHIIIYDRHIDDEFVWQYRLSLSLSKDNVLEVFNKKEKDVSFEDLTEDVLNVFNRNLAVACFCTTSHPTGHTLARWLSETGFSRINPTHNGGAFAGRLFDRIPDEDKPTDLATVDTMLRPLVDVVIGIPAPLDTDPYITAVK